MSEHKDKWHVQFVDEDSPSLLTQSRVRAELGSQLDDYLSRGGKVKRIKFGVASRPPVDEWAFLFSKRHANERK